MNIRTLLLIILGDHVCVYCVRVCVCAMRVNDNSVPIRSPAIKRWLEEAKLKSKQLSVKYAYFKLHHTDTACLPGTHRPNGLSFLQVRDRTNSGGMADLINVDTCDD